MCSYIIQARLGIYTETLIHSDNYIKMFFNWAITKTLFAGHTEKIRDLLSIYYSILVLTSVDNSQSVGEKIRHDS